MPVMSPKLGEVLVKTTHSEGTLKEDAYSFNVDISQSFEYVKIT